MLENDKYEKKWLIANKDRDYSVKNFIFTNSYHTPSTWGFLSNFDANSPLKMMEIGAQEGHTSFYLLNFILKHPKSKMYCLELFPESKYGMEKNFDHNVAVSGAKDKIVKLKGESWKSLRQIAEYESFDLIYIDGWHGAHSVLDDAIMSWKLLKVGGVLVFDDYSWSPKGATPERCPKIAVDAFYSIYGIFMEEIDGVPKHQKAYKKIISNNKEVEHCGEVGGVSFVPN